MNSTEGLSLYYHYQIFDKEELIDEDIFVNFKRCLSVVKSKQNQFIKSQRAMSFYATISCISHGLTVKIYSCLFDGKINLRRASKVNYDVCDKLGNVLSTVHSDGVAYQLAHVYDGYVRTYIQCLITNKKFYYE